VTIVPELFERYCPIIAGVAKPIGADKERRVRNLDEAFGSVLTDLRTSRRWSQQKLADIAGYDESYIRQLERGTKSATLRTLSDLASAFSFSVSVLIRRAEARMPKHH
jgi:ribosome-binding protein aMBF1 (putative translation factor)